MEAGQDPKTEILRNSMGESSARYLFIHVPKTAGTSVLRVFQRILGPQEVSPAVGANFDAVDLAALAGYRMVIGHFRRQQLVHFPDRKLLTFLRDPVDQVLSKYYFYRNMVDSDDPNVLMCKHSSLDDLLRKGGLQAAPFSNSCARQFAGIGPRGLVPSGEEFKLAVQTLADCEFVGIFEEMADSLDLMSYTFGWPPADEIPRENVTRKRKSVEELDQETTKRIRDMNELDIALYQYGRELFLTRKRAMMRAAVNQRAFEEGASTIVRPSLSKTVLPTPMPLRHHPGISAEDPKAAVRVLAVKVTGCGSNASVIRSGDPVEIAATLVANAAVEGILVAFHIHNRYGQLLFSSGTKRYDQEFSVSAGNTYRVAFRMPMNLAPGSYSVSIEAGTETSGERLLFHFLEDAASFDVQGYAQGSFRGVVDLRPAVSVQPDPGFAEAYHLGDTVRFSAGGESDRYARSGWAIAEDCGRWTVRKEAHLLMRLDRQPDICLALEAALFPFCPEQRPNLEVEVLINGHSIDTWHFTAPGSIERRQMAVPAQVAGTLTHILFRIREPVVPAHLGISSDTRALGLAMIELRLAEHPTQAP